MKTSAPLFSSTRLLTRYLGLVGIAVFTVFIVLYLMPNHRRLLAVGITGVHHMGENFNISEFYVDGYSGGNVGKGGGGGSDFCCVMLPEKWRPGLVAELRWSVSDWSKENGDEIKVGNYRSVTWTNFKAYVPVEKYAGEPEQLYVHFFAGGRARIVSSFPGPGSLKHPVQRGDAHASTVATLGTQVPSVFTKAELAEMKRKSDQHKAKHGSWR